MTGRPLTIATVEPTYPGRLGPLVAWLANRRGCVAWCFHNRPSHSCSFPGAMDDRIRPIPYPVGGVARSASVAWDRGLERGICHAYAAWEKFEATRPRGIDLVLGRSARLGSALFAPLAFPGTPVVTALNGYLAPDRGDLADEDAAELPAAYRRWRRASNAMDLLELEASAFCWTASKWERDSYPPAYRDAIQVRFEGVDTSRFSPERRPIRPLTLLGKTLPEGVRVVTFVARVADRLRGVDRFLSLANRLIRERFDLVCVVVGAGASDRMLEVRHHGRDFAAERIAADPPSDPSRLWRFEHLGGEDLARILAASDLHVAPGRPSGISRSLVEAMASGALVLATGGGPVAEYVEHGRTGLVADPDSPETLADFALQALEDRAGHEPIRTAAVAEVRDRFALDVCAPRLFEDFSRLLES